MKLQTALVCPKCEELVENSTQRCPSCGSDDPTVRCVMWMPGTFEQGEYECADLWHNEGRRPDPTRYAEHVKNGAGWKEPNR